MSAARHLRDLAAWQESELGPAHPDLANTLNNLAVASERAGDLDAAEAAFRRACIITRTAFDADHAFVATSDRNLREFCEAHGRPYEKPVTPTTSGIDGAAAPSGLVRRSSSTLVVVGAVGGLADRCRVDVADDGPTRPRASSRAGTCRLGQARFESGVNTGAEARGQTRAESDTRRQTETRAACSDTRSRSCGCVIASQFGERHCLSGFFDGSRRRVALHARRRLHGCRTARVLHASQGDEAHDHRAPLVSWRCFASTREPPRRCEHGRWISHLQSKYRQCRSRRDLAGRTPRRHGRPAPRANLRRSVERTERGTGNGERVYSLINASSPG